MLSKAKRGDLKFMADKLFITQQFTFLIIDSKSHGQSSSNFTAGLSVVAFSVPPFCR
jgi:hypothetical protein